MSNTGICKEELKYLHILQIHHAIDICYQRRRKMAVAVLGKLPLVHVEIEAKFVLQLHVQ